MKQPSNTVPPVVGPPRERSTLLGLFRSEHRRDAYYEASDRRGALYLLWMECVRFGMRMAYPCVLRQGDAAPLVFGSEGEDTLDANAALIERWEELDIASRAGELEIRELERADFRRKYRQFLGK